MATPATDTELKELKDLVIGLREEMRVGFANVDTKFAQVDTKLTQLEGKMDVKFAQVDTKLAKIEGDIALLRQPRDFGEFVKRAIVSGVTVTVIGGLLLAAWKLLIFGTV